MSEIVQTPASEEDGPKYELGSVNVDSLKALLQQLGTFAPWQDEVSAVAFTEKVATLDVAGDPDAPKSEASNAELSDAERRIAELEAELAQAKASESSGENSPPSIQHPSQA